MFDRVLNTSPRLTQIMTTQRFAHASSFCLHGVQKKIIGIILQNGQTHSNNSLIVADELFECVGHFAGLALKGLIFNISLEKERVNLSFMLFNRGQLVFELAIFFLFRFSFKDSDDSQDSRRRQKTIFIPFYHFLLLTKL